MNVPLVSLTALIVAIVVSCTTKINAGFLAIAFAWLIGSYLAGMNVNQIAAGFPSQLFLTLVGVTSGDLVWPDSEVHRRELTIRASRNATKDDFAHVMNSIETGLVPTGQLATHSTGFVEVAQFLPLWAKDRSGLIKAIVRL